MLGDAPRRPYADVLRELGVGDPDAFIDAELKMVLTKMQPQ